MNTCYFGGQLNVSNYDMIYLFLDLQYVLRDSVKNSSNGKDKPTYMLASRKEDQQLVSAGRAELLEDGTGISISPRS